MILFCAYLYDKLPNYMPSASIEFSSPLHQIVTKKVRILKLKSFRVNISFISISIKDKNIKSKCKEHILSSIYNWK